MDRLNKLLIVREEMLQKVEYFRGKIVGYQSVLADYDQEISSLRRDSPPADERTTDREPNDQKQKIAVKKNEFANKTQAEAAQIVLDRSGEESLHIGLLVNALEEGGLIIGGGVTQKKKDNLASSLARSGRFISDGTGHWRLKNSFISPPDKTSSSSSEAPSISEELQALTGKEKEALDVSSKESWSDSNH